MAAVPELGRASQVEPRLAPEAAETQRLYERYSGQILGFCLHQLGSREDAEDATQTTFLNAFRGLKRGIAPEAEQAWLYKIAHNVCLTRRRSSYRRGRVERASDIEALQDFVAAPQRMGADELIQLQEALAAMPDSQRKAILLREWRGLSYREIARELETTEAAVETLIFRARRSLARGLERPPQEARRAWRRLRHGFDVGSLLAAAKGLLAGGTAVNAVATAAAVGTVVVAAVTSHEPPPPEASAADVVAPKAPAVVPPRESVSAPPSSASVRARKHTLPRAPVAAPVGGPGSSVAVALPPDLPAPAAVAPVAGRAAPPAAPGVDDALAAVGADEPPPADPPVGSAPPAGSPKPAPGARKERAATRAQEARGGAKERGRQPDKAADPPRSAAPAARSLPGEPARRVTPELPAVARPAPAARPASARPAAEEEPEPAEPAAADEEGGDGAEDEGGRPTDLPASAADAARP